MAIEQLKNTFGRGELSPLMATRADTELYALGAKKLVNHRVLTQGGITRRNGTRFIAPARGGGSNDFIRLQPFIFSEIDAQVLEFKNNNLAFFKDGARVLDGGSPYEIVSPYDDDELFDMQFSQKSDVVFIAHPDHAPTTLTRTSLIDWAFEENHIGSNPAPLNPQTDFGILNAEFISTGVYKITPAAVGSADWKANVNSGQGFLASDITDKKQLYLKAADGMFYYYLITSVTTTENCEVTQINEADQTAAGNLAGSIAAFGNRDLGEIFQESAFCTVHGFPRAVTLFQNRLFYAGTAKKPQGIWGSENGLFDKFTIGILDTDSIFFDLDFEHNNAIQWLTNGSALYIGTRGEITALAGVDGILSPTKFTRLRGSYNGANNIPPIKVENGTYFIDKQGERVFSYGFSRDINGIDLNEVSVLSNHLFKTGVKQMAKTETGQSQLWILNTDGSLVNMAINEKQQVFAPQPNIFGGDLATNANGNAECLSVATVPSAEGDRTYVAVKRDIGGGSDSLFVEIIEKDFKDFSDFPDRRSAWFLDSALRYTGAPTTTVTGLDHLIGETVAIYGNGGVQTPKVVDGFGNVTLDQETPAPILVGLDYSDVSLIELLDIDGIMQNGTAQVQPKSVKGFWLYVFETGSFSYSTDGATFTNPAEIRDGIVFDEGQDLINRWINMFSDWNYQGHNYNETGARRIFKPSSGMPLTILAINTTIGS